MGTTANSRSDTSNSTSSSSSSTTTTAAGRAGDNCRNAIIATMYEINTCSAMNCNPGKSTSMHETGRAGDEECRGNQQRRDKDKDEDDPFLDIPNLQRLWRRIIFSSGHTKPDPAATSNGSTRRRKSYSTERCDENLNGFYVVLVIVTFVCYLNGLNGDFVHDDIPAITMNKDVVALNPAIALFKNDFWGTAMSDASSHKSYRPLTTVSFR